MKIDVRQEIEQFEWSRARWTSDKLIATSPFRYDNTPSFFVSLETGGWCDSGAVDPSWGSGGFVKLLAFLRNETEEETREYLRYKYDVEWDGDTDKLELAVKLPLAEAKKQPLDMSILQQFRFRHPYLGGRGISEEVQRKMRIGYDKRSRAVTIPWFLPDGRLANIKYRRTDSKIFWYQKGGLPLRELVYGIDIVYKERSRQAVLVEGEVDALYLMTAGFTAIAIGGSAFTDAKAELIKRSPLESVVISTDNDEVGERIKAEMVRKLGGCMDLQEATVPKIYKDPNEVKSLEKLRDYHVNTVNIGIIL